MPHKILYLSVSYVPSRRASSVHVMKMANALARAGHDVTLVTKGASSRELTGENSFKFYGLQPNFRLIKLPRPTLKGGGILYSYAIWRLLRRGSFDLVYSRDIAGAAIAARMGFQTVFEAHALPRTAIERYLWRLTLGGDRFRRIVTISHALCRDVLASGYGDTKADIVVAHDAADSVRPELSFGSRGGGRRPQIGYVGSLYVGKGSDLVLRLAAMLPEMDFHLVGGGPEEVACLRDAAPPNVQVHGFVPHGSLVPYYTSFDVVLLPMQAEVYGASGKTNIGAWSSPMKLFEYMAAGCAIVASDLPVLREVLKNEHTALLRDPLDTLEWAAAIRRLMSDSVLRANLQHNAREQLEQEHTWDARAQKVLLGL